MNEPNIGLEVHSFMLVSDVHSDIEALERILSKPANIRYRCSLGDAIGYGESPVEVIKTLAEFDVGIMGNHDSLALGRNKEELFTESALLNIRRNLEKISGRELGEMSKYATNFSRDGIILFHGTPDEPNEYLLNELDIRKLIQEYPSYELFFGGHLHIPRLAYYDKKTGEIGFDNVSIPFSHHLLELKNRKYVVNCPSVVPGIFGYPNGYCALFHISEQEKILNFYFLE